ncbi:MAG: ImmA/IrrE family metallo-endopeptidase [Holophagaceae bacterium]|jgi:hypothetical protein|nr:ImmA/IrrE family metallo-endopeptidase [Holophagaceae bacterium]
MNPAWYGKRYPTMEGLIEFGESIGAYTSFDPLICTAWCVTELWPHVSVAGAYEPVSIILIPENHSPLAAIWALAHELGHLLQHSGPGGKPFWPKDEAQAYRWAACALIPKARIKKYNNASIDSFMASLSANYEQLPLRDCPSRELAHKIAKIRLDVLAAKREIETPADL